MGSKSDSDGWHGYPAELWRSERELLARRRRGIPGEPEARPAVGFGLSGGGIRSATFSLGLFQALARLKLLRRIDYLSTVSGGGYFGSFFGALFARQCDACTAEGAEEILAEEKRPEVVQFLRDNGRYLSPSGSGDMLLGGSVLLRNWVAIQLVLLTFLLAGFLFLQVVRRSVPWPELSSLDPGFLWWSPWMLLPLGVFGILALPTGWAYWMVGKHPFPAPWVGLFSALVAGAALCFLPPESFGWLGPAINPRFLGLGILGTGLMTAFYWGYARWRCRSQAGKARDAAQRNFLSKRLTLFLLLAGATFGLGLLDSLGQTLYAFFRHPEGGLAWQPWLAGITGAIGSVAAFARKITVFFQQPGQDRRPRFSVSALATVAALLLIFVLCLGVNTLSHGFVWQFRKPEVPAGFFAPPPAAKALAVKEESGSVTVSLAATVEKPVEAEPSGEPRAPWIAFGTALLFSLLFGHAPAFLNRSGHQALYASRLTRAYLGASNPDRKPGVALNQALASDDVPVDDYWGPGIYDRGAPIHFVNVTVNETVDAKSQIQQQDRKGTGLAIGPHGMSLGIRHHLLLDWTQGPRVTATTPAADSGHYRVFRQPTGAFTGEKMSLGSWVGISGAAFSTGTGYRTSLGLSLLAGFGNIRLGHWWNPGAQPPKPRGSKLENVLFRAFPVQSFLLSEFLARFPGTARKWWYLSDGGHFENLGGYELVRRRLPFIVIVDAEADPDYGFEGLANLVRKARIDFRTEIDFLEEEELNDVLGKGSALRRHFGELGQLRRGKWGREPRPVPGDPAAPDRRLIAETDRLRHSAAHAALGRIRYPDDGGAREGWLLYIKPTLLGDEPADLAEYHANHPDFPHESTADQFFDEAQWESYRKLGEEIGDRLFAPSASARKWSPRESMGG